MTAMEIYNEYIGTDHATAVNQVYAIAYAQGLADAAVPSTPAVPSTLADPSV